MHAQTAQSSLQVRPADERGRTELGWLHSRHSFSFGGYYDPANLGYRALRVINDDVVEPGTGFGEHGHANMEILTWVLDGALRHGDSTGGGGVIHPGELQAMSAGRGIRHSEFNASSSKPVHLLQIWIEPASAARNIRPAYAQAPFDREGRRGRWQTLASADGREQSLRINQDAVMSVTELAPPQRIEATVAGGRYGYLHVARGEVRIAGSGTAAQVSLTGGDAVTVTGPARLNITADDESQMLLFVLP